MGGFPFEGEISSEASLNEQWVKKPPYPFPPAERNPTKLAAKSDGQRWRLIHAEDSGLLPGVDVSFKEGTLYSLKRRPESESDTLTLSFTDVPHQKIATYYAFFFRWSKYAKYMVQRPHGLKFEMSENGGVAATYPFKNLHYDIEIVNRCGVYRIASVAAIDRDWIKEESFTFDCAESGEWTPVSMARSTTYSSGARSYQIVRYKNIKTSIGDDYMPAINRRTQVIDTRVRPPFVYWTSKDVKTVEEVLAESPESRLHTVQPDRNPFYNED